MADWKKWVLRPLVVGSAVVLATPFVNDLLTNWLGMIPSSQVFGLTFPHGYLAAGVSFLVVETLIQKVKFLDVLR